MTCEELAPQLSAYASGSAQGAGDRRVEDHLRACPACAATLAEERALLLRLALPAQPPAPSLAAETWARHRARGEARRPRWVAAVAALAAAAVLAGAWLALPAGSGEGALHEPGAAEEELALGELEELELDAEQLASMDEDDEADDELFIFDDEV